MLNYFRNLLKSRFWQERIKKYTEQLYLSLVSMLSKYEKAVLTYYLEGLSYKEIAKLTGKGDKAVDNAIQRIRRKTAQMLKSGDISNS